MTYVVHGQCYRIGQAVPGGPRVATLIAAANPGRRLPAAENRRREARLRAAVARLGAAEGWSGQGVWREAQFRVPLARQGRLARRFGQAAVVVLRRGRRAELAWL